MRMHDTKAVMTKDLGDYRAIVFFDLTSGYPRANEIRIVPADDGLDVDSLLSDWEPSGSGGGFTFRRLRDLDLPKMERTVLSRTQVNEYDSGLPLSSQGLFCMSDFRRPQGYIAALERCRVAQRYEELMLAGCENPCQQIADDFYGGRLNRAKNVIANARIATPGNPEPWLTRGVQGKPSGVMTRYARKFAEVNRDELAKLGEAHG